MAVSISTSSSGSILAYFSSTDTNTVKTDKATGTAFIVVFVGNRKKKVTRQSRRKMLECHHEMNPVVHSQNGWRFGCIHCGSLCR